MMNHCRNMLEKPLVGTVTYPKDILMLNTAQFRPAFRDDGPSTSAVNSIEDCVDHFLRIVENNAAKSNVNGRRTGLEELEQILWWRVCGRVSKEESANVCVAVRGIRGRIGLGHPYLCVQANLWASGPKLATNNT